MLATRRRFDTVIALQDAGVVICLIQHFAGQTAIFMIAVVRPGRNLRRQFNIVDQNALPESPTHIDTTSSTSVTFSHASPL
jgi:hypothetical protein